MTASYAEKNRKVRQIFDDIAQRYDLMNDLLSAGTHRLWKQRAVTTLNPQAGQILLDVAGGTGDISALWRKKGGGRAVICDRSEKMLLAATNMTERICGDAVSLPVQDCAADAVAIAFGLRNVGDMRAALIEMLRVLKPGGRFICLEFSHVDNRLLEIAYDAFSFAVIPRLGRVAAGNENAYRYLIESIRRFPNQTELAAIMRECGFARVRYDNMSGGIVAMHSGWKNRH